MNAVLACTSTQPVVTAFLAEGLERVDALVRSELATPLAPVAELCEQVERYRGKMLRPTLVFLSGLAVDPALAEPTDGLVVLATVVEMVHMATLVHDDVLDEADIRRGGETVNRRRGNEAAVILGDYLISKAFHLCSSLDSQRVSLRIGEATNTVCEGEILQLAHRGDFTLPEALYFEIIRRKTAALIAVACELGARLAGAPPALAASLHAFGERIGTAFQIRDDLLDLVGDARLVGKTLGRDAETGTLTLPLIHHLARLAADERAAAAARLRAGSREALIRSLVATGSVDHARAAADRLIVEAKTLLAPLPDSPAREALASLADAVVQREF